LTTRNTNISRPTKRRPSSQEPRITRQLTLSLSNDAGASDVAERKQLLNPMRGPSIVVVRAKPSPTAAYETYWLFAYERQEIFFRRLSGQEQPWTADEILAQYKFTNAYRASDRTSQYLIGQVLYAGSKNEEEVFFRALLFKLFNKIETWDLLSTAIGFPEYRTYDFEKYDAVLTRAIDSGRRIYSAAYIMPSGGRSNSTENRKHRHHLHLLASMMKDRLPFRITKARSMDEGFRLLRSYRSIGDFLAFQLITDINYSEMTAFREDEFVMPGPGARDGIRKCFSSLGDYSEADAIRLVQERQQQEFDKRGLPFRTLWGRALQLIDCQSLFCEVDKYSRVRHPELAGLSGRTRIKQHFAPRRDRVAVWYPPKWGINKRVADWHDELSVDSFSGPSET
jgi:hypothetical protein